MTFEAGGICGAKQQVGKALRRAKGLIKK